MNLYIQYTEKHIEHTEICVDLKPHIYFLLDTDLLKFLTFKFLDTST